MKRGGKKGFGGEDRRTYQRLPVSLAATFAIVGIESQAAIADISMVGCAMRTITKLHAGAIVRVLMRTAEDTAPIAIEAGVVRHVQRNLAGVEFLKLKKIDRERLLQFIDKLLQQRKNRPADLDRQRKPLVHYATAVSSLQSAARRCDSLAIAGYDRFSLPLVKLFLIALGLEFGSARALFFRLAEHVRNHVILSQQCM